MNLLQELESRVRHTNDVSQVDAVLQTVMHRPAPDARAAELRDRLMEILSQMVQTVNNGKHVDQRLTAEFNKWHEDYTEWFKGAH